jgi:ribosomal biogenesis protein LAS1
VTWIIETWKTIPDLKMETLSILLRGLGYDPSPLPQKAAYVLSIFLLFSQSLNIVCSAFDLLRRLCTGLEEMEAMNILLSKESSNWSKTVSYYPEVSTSFFVSNPSRKWNPCDLDMMEKRHEQLRSFLHSLGEINSRHPDETMAEPAQDIAIPGWCILVENRGWKSCPIGIYNEN